MIESMIVLQGLPATISSEIVWARGSGYFQGDARSINVGTKKFVADYLWDGSFNSELKRCRKLSETS